MRVGKSDRCDVPGGLQIQLQIQLQIRICAGLRIVLCAGESYKGAMCSLRAKKKKKRQKDERERDRAAPMWLMLCGFVATWLD